MLRATPIALGDSDIASLLVRNPATAAQVAYTQAAMLVLTPDQIVTPPDWYQVDLNIGLIPPWGISVNDSVFGTVLISWDANYNWHYIANSPISSTVVNSPWYVSPTTGASAPCDPTTGDFAGMLCSLSNTAKTALSIVAVYLLYTAIK